MDDRTLTLPIGAQTQRKLLALAMLMDSNVGSLEEELSGFLDQMITEKCAELLGIQTAPTMVYQVAADGVAEEVPPAPKKSFATAHQEAAGSREDEAFSQIPIQDEISGHELSADEDTGETKSLAEQAEEDEDAEMLAVFNSQKVKDVGDNAEAFAEVAMSQNPPRSDDGMSAMTYGGERVRKASGSFEERRKKGLGARVELYSDDD
jgi:hypothetical protein